MIAKLFGIMVVASFSLAGMACVPLGSIVGRGPVETHSQDFSGFTKLEIFSTFNVEVVRDASYSVTVTTNQNIFDYLDFQKDGDTLKVKLKTGSYTVASLKAKVTLPNLASLEVNGASYASLNGFTSTSSLKLTASGASTIELVGAKCGDLTADISGASRIKGTLESGNAIIDLSGASNVSLSGRAQNLNVTSSGASHVTLTEFTTSSAKVNFSGASSGDVNTSGRLDLSLSGASSLKYHGNATLGDVNVTGASSLNKG